MASDGYCNAEDMGVRSSPYLENVTYAPLAALLDTR